MSDPNDPTEPMDPIGDPDDSTPDIDPSESTPDAWGEDAVDPDDATRIYEEPLFPEDATVAMPPVGAAGDPYAQLPPDDIEELEDEEYEGWWAERTPGERAALAIAVILVGVLIAVLMIGGGDDETTDTLPPVGGVTTTSVAGDTTTIVGGTTTTVLGDTTTVAGETTTTAPGETTTTLPGETTTTSPEGTTTTAPPSAAFPSLQGTGTETVAFTMPDDSPAAISLTHDGTQSFVAIALDANGNPIATLTERRGTYMGTVLVNLYPDLAPISSLEIIADGNWRADAMPLSDLDVVSVSNLGGDSDGVYRLDQPSSEEVTVTHDGELEFLINGFTSSGALSKLVEEFGPYTGPVTIPAGTAYLEVIADGSWTFVSG